MYICTSHAHLSAEEAPGGHPARAATTLNGQTAVSSLQAPRLGFQPKTL